MRKIATYTIVSALLCLIVVQLANALTQQTEPPASTASTSASNTLHSLKKSLNNKQQSVYDVAPQVIALLVESEKYPAQAQGKLAQIEAHITLNEAERYLIAIVKANIVLAKKDYKQAIVLLAEAQKNGTNLAKQQLNTPNFFHLNYLLAQCYAAVGNFEQAYNQKKLFLKKYRAFYKAQKAATVALLKSKYQTNLKTQENELLKQQNRLEAIKIADTELAKHESQRNTLLLTAIALIFLLLLVKQIYVRAELKKLARLDSLTKLYNRRQLFKRGERLVSAAITAETTLSVCLFDIDHFKAINDQHGHHVGDQVLLQISNLARETMRSRDVLARLGGEEFVALLPDATIDEAKAIAERLREKIAEFDYSTFGMQTPVTASFGVAQLTTDTNSLDGLLQRADEAMYQAKVDGRNRVISHHYRI